MHPGVVASGEALWDELVAGRWQVVARRTDADHGRVLWEARRTPPHAVEGRALNAKQRQVVDGIGRGLSLGEIAYELGIGLSTVSTHLANSVGRLSIARSDIPLLAGTRHGPQRRGGGRLLTMSPCVTPRLLPELTPAELSVCRLALCGVGRLSIARARATSARTVSNQLAFIFRKLHVAGRLEAAALVCRRDARWRSSHQGGSDPELVHELAS